MPGVHRLRGLALFLRCRKMSDTSGEELVELRADNKSLKQENARLLRDRNDAINSCNDAINSSQQLWHQLNKCRAELDAQSRSNADLSRRLAVCEHTHEAAVKSQTCARRMGAAPACQRALHALPAAVLRAAPGCSWLAALLAARVDCGVLHCMLPPRTASPGQQSGGSEKDMSSSCRRGHKVPLAA